MSTPPAFDKKFQDDNNAMLADATEVQNLIWARDGKPAPHKTPGDNSIFHTELGKISKNPDVALMQLFALLYASPTNATMGGIVQDNIGVTGAQLKLNGALTTVNNDLNNMVNSNSKNSDDLDTFKTDIQTVITELGDKSLLGNPEIMDQGANGSVQTQLTTIVNLFQGKGAKFGKAKGLIHSFHEYQKLLNEQGDQKSVTEAAKTITDGFSTATQTTQTASAVLNNDMKTYSALLQAIQQFDTAIAQVINAIRKASVNHTASGS